MACWPSPPTSTSCARRSRRARSPLYGGFDPTAPGLHIGNLVLLLTLRRLPAGRPPADRPGRRGDRPDRRPERQVGRAGAEPARGGGGLDAADPRPRWSAFLDFGPGPAGALLVSNLDWTQELSALDFLRDIGKHFPVNQMLARESVRARLEGGGISYTEFSYQLLQAMDFLELHRRYGCTLQVGGSDQWGNLVGGVDLIKRVDGRLGARAGHAADHQAGRDQVRQDRGRGHLAEPGPDEPVRVLPVLDQPVATPRSAACCGCSRSGPARRSAELELATAERPAAREAQRVLAAGRDDAGARRRRSTSGRRRPAGRCSARATCRELDEATLTAALDEVPRLAVVHRCGGLPAARLADSWCGVLPPVSDLMAQPGIVASKSAARRAIAEGGAYLNNRKVTDENEVPTTDDLLARQVPGAQAGQARDRRGRGRGPGSHRRPSLDLTSAARRANVSPAPGRAGRSQRPVPGEPDRQCRQHALECVIRSSSRGRLGYAGGTRQASRFGQAI